MGQGCFQQLLDLVGELLRPATERRWRNMPEGDAHQEMGGDRRLPAVRRAGGKNEIPKFKRRILYRPGRELGGARDEKDLGRDARFGREGSQAMKLECDIGRARLIARRRWLPGDVDAIAFGSLRWWVLLFLHGVQPVGLIRRI